MTDRELMQHALNALVTAELDGNCEYGVTDALRARLAQPEPEWQGLTDEDRAEAWAKTKGDLLLRLPPFSLAIEAKLKEKNG